MKKIFRAGDKVELLPYDQVKNHLGVSRRTWERLCSIIPMTIDFIDGDDLCTRETGFFFIRFLAEGGDYGKDVVFDFLHDFSVCQEVVAPDVEDLL